MKKILITVAIVSGLASCSKKDACESSRNIMYSNQSIYNQTLAAYYAGDANMDMVNAKLNTYTQSAEQYQKCLEQNQ